jgi:glyoxylase-like metal-dependent hydrolase (beta-lactamase superfamily II)
MSAAARGMISRRGLFACLAASAPLSCGCGWEAWAAAAPDAETLITGPPVADRPLQGISRHVYMIEAPGNIPTPDNAGFMSNLTFIVGEKGVAAVDSGSSTRIAEMGLRQLKALTGLPVVALINTHFHGDHWLGNQAFVDAFGKDLPIHAMAGTRAAIEGAVGAYWRESMLKWTDKATLGTKIAAPNHDVEHGLTLDLGGVTLRLHHYGVAHTPFDLAVEIVQDEVMCAGDIVMDRRIAIMDDGSFRGTLEAIDALESNSRTKIWLPAHGMAGEGVARWQRELFAGIYERCVEAVRQGVPPDGALALALKDPRVAARTAQTRGFDRNIGRYVALAYLEAEQAQF